MAGEKAKGNVEMRWPSQSADLVNVTEVYLVNGTQIEYELAPETDKVTSRSDCASEMLIQAVQYATGISYLEETLLANLLFVGRHEFASFENFLLTWLKIAPHYCIGVNRCRFLSMTTAFAYRFPNFHYPDVVKVPYLYEDASYFFDQLNSRKSEAFDFCK
jgi:hypothetical protein